MKHIPKLILTLLIATLGTFVGAAQAPAGVEADEMRWRGKAMAAVEAAVPQAAKDPTRPVYHFRPPAQWMNDICGAIYHQGYHPGEDELGIAVFAENGSATLESLDVWEMKSIW